MWKYTPYVPYGLAVMGIVILGFTLDIFSRAPTRHQPYSSDRPGIYATGTVEGATNESFLHVQSKGRIVEILAGEGQVVEKGAVLLQLDDALQRHERALAEANLRGAQAQLEQLRNGARPEERAEALAIYQARQAELERAEKSWQRMDALVRDGAATAQSGEDEWALFQSAVKQAAAAKARYDLLNAPPREDEVLRLEAEVSAMEARLEVAEEQLERTRLRAPMSCRVLRLNVELGELTGPESPVAPVVVADTSHLRVRAFVEELDALRVREGMLARVTAPGLSEREFPGRVGRLSPRMATKRLFSDRPDELYDTKTREVWIDLDDPGEELLLIGLRVDVWIDVE